MMRAETDTVRPYLTQAQAYAAIDAAKGLAEVAIAEAVRLAAELDNADLTLARARRDRDGLATARLDAIIAQRETDLAEDELAVVRAELATCQAIVNHQLEATRRLRSERDNARSERDTYRATQAPPRSGW